MRFTQPDLFAGEPAVPGEKRGRDRGPLTAEERRRVAEFYLNDVKVTDICDVIGCSVSAVYNVLTREGIKRRQPSSGTLRTFCQTCGKPVGYVPPVKRKEGLGRFCSQACMGEAKRLPASLRGETTEELPCTKCGQSKPVAEFYPHAKIARGYQYWCKECTHAERVERAKIPTDPLTIRKYKLAGYGLTPEDYEARYERQGGRCAICGIKAERWRPGGRSGHNNFLTVDHDHSDGHIRGLLCGHCNRGLGQFRDNIETMRAAITYLESDSAQQAGGFGQLTSVPSAA